MVNSETESFSSRTKGTFGTGRGTLMIENSTLVAKREYEARYDTLELMTALLWNETGHMVIRKPQLKLCTAENGSLGTEKATPSVEN